MAREGVELIMSTRTTKLLLNVVALIATLPFVIAFTCRVRAQDQKPVYRINCGGPAVGSYSADVYFEGGKTYTQNAQVDTADVPNAPPAQIYNTQRYGNFTYTFPNLNPGAGYIVRLHFAETYFADPRPGRYNSAKAGQRVFVVMMNHKVVLDRFDILATASPNHAVVKEFNTTADEAGRVKIAFQPLISSESMINAIEILKGPASSSPVSSTPRSETPSRDGSSNGRKVPATKVFNAQHPCDDDDARQTKGVFDFRDDELANADPTFPKDQYPIILKKADQAMELLERDLHDLSGVDIEPYRSITHPYVAKGPVPFEMNAPVFSYGCVPMSAPNPRARGTITRFSGETATWIYFYFNSVGWLANERMVRGHTVNGAKIYEMPKVKGELNGFPLLAPELHVGVPDEAILITPDGSSPFKPLSREKFLLAEQKRFQDELDKLQKMSPVPASGVAQRQSELTAINNMLNSLSPEEKQQQAIVNYKYGFEWGRGRNKVFVSEAEGGEPLVTLEPALFKPTTSRTAVKIITVYWRTDRTNAAQSALIRRFKEKFDFQALRKMLDQ